MQGTVVNDDVSTLLEGGNLVLQDLGTRLIWPVVEDGSEEVDGCAFDWLLIEDGIWHELETILDVGWNFGWSFFNDTRQILDDEVEVWEAFGKSYRDRSVRTSQREFKPVSLRYSPPGTAHVDHGSFAKRSPVESIEQRLEWYHGGKSVHGTCESLSTLWIGLHLVVESSGSVES